MAKRQSLLLISALFALSAADVSASGSTKVKGSATAALASKRVARGPQLSAPSATDIPARGTDQARYDSYMTDTHPTNGLGIDAESELRRSMLVGEERAATLVKLQGQLAGLDPQNRGNVREITKLSEDIEKVKGHIAANEKRQKNLAVFTDEFEKMTPEARAIVSQRRTEILGDTVDAYKEHGLRRRSPSQARYSGLSDHVNALAAKDASASESLESQIGELQSRHAREFAALERQLPTLGEKATKTQVREREDAYRAVERRQQDENDALRESNPLPSSTVNLGDLADEFVAEKGAASALGGARPSPTKFNDSDLQF